jgi:hypothetical protein
MSVPNLDCEEEGIFGDGAFHEVFRKSYDAS